MKTLAFTYTKDDGSISKRVVHLTKEPSTMFSGVDLSELNIEDIGSYVVEMQEAREIFNEMISQINDKFDTHKRYRNFIPAKMTDIKAL